MSYCPRCGSNHGDLSWHDTPADSALVAGNTGIASETSSISDSVKMDVPEPAAVFGDTPKQVMTHLWMEILRKHDWQIIDRLAREFTKLEYQRDEARHERDAFAIENEALRRDAERYRFLKSRIEVKNAIPIFLSLNNLHPQTFDMGIDESIDEAMK